MYFFYFTLRLLRFFLYFIFTVLKIVCFNNTSKYCALYVTEYFTIPCNNTIIYENFDLNSIAAFVSNHNVLTALFN